MYNSLYHQENVRFRIKSDPAKKRDRRHNRLSAAESAQLAEDLPNRAAIRSAVGVAIKEEHLADLLSVFASRRQRDCSQFVIFFQAVNAGIPYSDQNFTTPIQPWCNGQNLGWRNNSWKSVWL
jgi:hypothetical protein